jgi:hypothetical protein
MASLVVDVKVRIGRACGGRVGEPVVERSATTELCPCRCKWRCSFPLCAALPKVRDGLVPGVLGRHGTLQEWSRNEMENCSQSAICAAPRPPPRQSPSLMSLARASAPSLRFAGE